MTKAKKLPDVWVAIDPEGVAWAGTDKGFAPSRTEDCEIARYTPAKPAKVCVWDESGLDYFKAECGDDALYPYGFDYAFCPNCGGKIKIKVTR